MLAFGLVGLFVGPVVLAVAYTLLVAWIDEVPEEGELLRALTSSADGARGSRSARARSLDVRRHAVPRELPRERSTKRDFAAC
jgi:hypothetical protein